MRWRNRQTAAGAHREQAKPRVERRPAGRHEIPTCFRGPVCEDKPVSNVVGNGEAPPRRGRGDDPLSDDRAAQLYAAIVQSSEQAILSTDLSGVILTWNQGAQWLFGYSSDEAIGKPVTIIFPADQEDEETTIFDRIRHIEAIDQRETVLRRKDGSLVDVSLTASPIWDRNGTIIGSSKIASDITERKRAQERQQLLLSEMDHRIKNLFSLAISVVRLSGRSASSVDELIRSASERLSALARAHALTLSHGLRDTSQAAKPTTLHSLTRAIVAPYEELGDVARPRFSIVGCDIEITGAAVSSMALLLHEFATNSAKYGSLSAAEGQIEIDCGNHGQNVVLTWTEREGPAVAPPADNEGFGAVLVRSTVKGHLGGDISYDWSPGGLVIRLSIPIARLSG